MNTLHPINTPAQSGAIVMEVDENLKQYLTDFY